jgi:hypothetical protein
MRGYLLQLNNFTKVQNELELKTHNMRGYLLQLNNFTKVQNELELRNLFRARQQRSKSIIKLFMSAGR